MKTFNNITIYQYITLLYCFACLVACNDGKLVIPGQSNLPVTVSDPNTLNGCYGYKSDALTIQMLATTSGDTVTGHLAYNFAEKDDNTGTIKGAFIGDTLFADYTFQSEGMETVREVAFLKTGDNLKEGYGDVDDQNGKIIFKNRGFLIFPGRVTLSKSKEPCKN